MMIILFFYILCIYTCEGAIQLIQFQNGLYTINFLFNDQLITESKVMFVGGNGLQLYFATVYSNSTTPNLLCRQQAQQKIITGPNGCSDLYDQTKALISTNCIQNDVEQQLLKETFLKTWFYSSVSQECYSLGGDGSKKLCPGPLYLTQDNRDSFIPSDITTDIDIYASRMAFLSWFGGPMAMSPIVIQVRIELPPIYITTSCFSTSLGASYNGSYYNYEQDPYPDMLTDVWKVWKGPYPDQRLILRRISSDSFSFKIWLGTDIGAGGNYTFEYESITTIGPSDLDSGIFLNWIEQIQWGQVYTMASPTAPTTGVCSLILYRSNITYPPFSILPPLPIVRSNYTYNVYPPVYYYSRYCNYVTGRLDQNGRLFYYNCLEGERCGGYPSYVSPEYPNLKLYVEPRPDLPFVLDCTDFYPKSETFLDIAGTQRPRISIAQGVCLSPFLSVDIINTHLLPDETFTQCQKMGGYTWNKAITNCARSITQVYCQKGYIYFDQRCFKKFSPLQDSRYSVVLDQYTQSCTLLSEYARPLLEVDIYTNIWLVGWFLYWQQTTTVAAYRVPQFGSNGRCVCYQTLTYTAIQCDCYTVSLSFNGTTEIPIFPICYYDLSVSEMEPPYRWESLSLEAATLFTEGQIGPKQMGYPALCNCFPGSAGGSCERTTCLLPTELLSNPDNLPRITFQQKCNFNGRGECYNGQPLCCECNFPYGPSACITPDFPILYQFKNTPCSCPAGALTNGSFEINGEIYTGNFKYLPCSGIGQGKCIVNNATNTGVCECVSRINLVFGNIEPAFDGKACSCPTPIQPFNADVKNGIIVTERCNNHGTCCPFGQTMVNDAGDIFSTRCFKNDKEQQGCQCDNGRGGLSCTCPTPYDVAYGLYLQSTGTTPNYIYIDLQSLYFIKWIRITGCLGMGQVIISNNLQSPNATHICTYNSTLSLYFCDSVISYQYVAVTGITSSLGCKIEAYERYYSYCGANQTVNTFSGTFYSISAYRGPSLNLLNQPMETAIKGCTNTECMCNSQYGGPLCGYRVSSIKPYIIERDEEQVTIQAKEYCSTTLSLPSYLEPEQGAGTLDENNYNCSCNAISFVGIDSILPQISNINEERFSGEACQCAIVYNNDLSPYEPIICAGNGVCEDPYFPYGECEVDINKFALDALYTPYIPAYTFQQEYTIMEIGGGAEDAYFIVSI